MVKMTEDRLFATPEAAARQIVKLAATIEPAQDGRVFIEKINAPFLYTLKGSGEEFSAGIEFAVAQGWLMLHESGTYVKLTGSEGILRI